MLAVVFKTNWHFLISLNLCQLNCILKCRRITLMLRFNSNWSRSTSNDSAWFERTSIIRIYMFPERRAYTCSNGLVRLPVCPSFPHSLVRWITYKSIYGLWNFTHWSRSVTGIAVSKNYNATLHIFNYFPYVNNSCPGYNY